MDEWVALVSLEMRICVLGSRHGGALMPAYSLKVGHPGTERKQVSRSCHPSRGGRQCSTVTPCLSSRRGRWVSLAEEEALGYVMVSPSLRTRHTILASGREGESWVC